MIIHQTINIESKILKYEDNILMIGFSVDGSEFVEVMTLDLDKLKEDVNYYKNQ